MTDQEQIAALQAQLGAALEALSHVVAQANVNAVGGEFIERYDMPVGSIHKAIPLLAEHGIVVDVYGYVHRSPLASAPSDALAEHDREVAAQALEGAASFIPGVYLRNSGGPGQWLCARAAAIRKQATA